MEKPVGQSRQAVAPAAEYLPIGQFVQVDSPADAAYFPAKQFVHTGEPSAEYCPAGQSVHCNDAAADENLPAVQSTQAAPSELRVIEPVIPFFPAAHFVQQETPSVAEVPDHVATGQLVHAVAPAREYDPWSQIEEHAASLDVPLYFPAAHGRHASALK